jgi:hypothetical protein
LAARHGRSRRQAIDDATKYVASRSHPTLEWRNSVLIEGDAAVGIAGLKLVDNKVSTTGVMIGTYEPAGEIVTGSFALD